MTKENTIASAKKQVEDYDLPLVFVTKIGRVYDHYELVEFTRDDAGADINAIVGAVTADGRYVDFEAAPAAAPHQPAPAPTMRDQYIMAALTGLLANPARDSRSEAYAKDACVLADAVIAMLTARSAPTPE